MTYNKNTWHRGDVVSSSGLNNMEDGIAANDAAISEIHDPAKSAIENGGIGYYDKTTLLNETIPVADWVEGPFGAYAEIDVTGIEVSADKKYWIVIDGVETECHCVEEDDYWYIIPVDETTDFPGIGTNSNDNYSLILAELPTEPVSFQLIGVEAQKINSDFVPGVYDLVLVGFGGENYPQGKVGDILDYIQVVEGSIEAAATKARNGEYVRGVMYWVCDGGYYSTFVLNDFFIDDSYSVIRFGGIYVEIGIDTLIHYSVSIVYDESYELTSATGTKYTIYQGSV